MTHILTVEDIKSHKNLPAHVAIIMDGNGRWAKKKGLPRIAGHSEGINSVREIVEIAGELGIQYLTLYTFSQENWERPAREVKFLMGLLLETIRKEIKNLHKNNVKVSTIGNINALPEKSRRGILEGVEYTKNNTGLNLILALSYGSRDEILLATKTIVKNVLSGELNEEDITQDTISQNLYTRDIPDPDFVIRTSGEQRISNFLLWQVAYAEFYITPLLWPAFRKKEFLEALSDYLTRDRRFGRLNEN